jgi:tRNA (guanine37-N1)-methyltransferase
VKISVLTLFPEMFSALDFSITGRAQNSKLIEIAVIDIRAYSKNKHKKCDDYPYGGGSGMVMSVQPIYDAVNAVDPAHKARRIYMSAQGNTLNQQKVKELSSFDNLLILCGHYEGVDQRIIDTRVTDEISIGDYVLSSGEIAAMVLVDAIYRLRPGVISGESLEEESFSKGLLEYPQYTRPAVYDTMKVPDVVLSGNHAQIARWRLKASIAKTLAYRPELLTLDNLPVEASGLLREVIDGGGWNEPGTVHRGRTDQE